MTQPLPNRSQDKKKIKLALQGGGAYGAFTWGVLDRLLEDERIEITAVSGASAGAMNAVALAEGMDKNGADGARKHLKALWEGMKSDKYNVASVFSNVFNVATSRLKNVLQERLDKAVDFQFLKDTPNGLPFFVIASDIDSHKPRVFTRKDICAKAVKASCAVPFIFSPIELEGRRYWDGALTDNPAISPMEDVEGDLMIIQTFPLLEHTTTNERFSTQDRILEFGLNASIRKDVNAIQKDNERYDKNPKAAKALGIRKTHTHLINIGRSIKSSRAMDFDHRHVDKLYQKGRQAADLWLAQNAHKLGVESTFTGDTPKKAAPPAPKKHQP
ncbi:MAG: patatin-like phospholipase family protein [Pseudomonadota bacterium]